MRIEFFPAAERELVEAAEDYEAKARGLGSDFIVEVERIAGVLIELPSLGEKLDPIHRRIPLRRFTIRTHLPLRRRYHSRRRRRTPQAQAAVLDSARSGSLTNARAKQRAAQA